MAAGLADCDGWGLKPFTKYCHILIPTRDSASLVDLPFGGSIACILYASRSPTAHSVAKTCGVGFTFTARMV